MTKQPSKANTSIAPIKNQQTAMILKEKNLSVTALYTAHCWYFAGFPFAQYFISQQTQAVFDITNFFLKLSKLWRKDFYDLPEGLAQRHAMLDILLNQVLQAHQIHPKPIIIELACGLSQRGLCFRQQGYCYYEVDLQQVIDAKKELYLQIPSSEISEINWHLPFLLVEDLKNKEWAFLEQIKKNHPDQQSYLILAEGLLMYLNARERFDFIDQISRLQPSAFLFDFIPTQEQPKPGRLGKLLGKLMRSFTKQSFVEDQQSREDLLKYAYQKGFHSAQCYETHLLTDIYPLPFENAKTQQLIFMFSMMPQSQVSI